MYTTLIRQYQLVLSSRNALFDYCETINAQDLHKPVVTMNNTSMAQATSHIADTYISWLANFAMQEQRPYSTPENYYDVAALRALFEQVNLVMNDFLHHFNDRLDVPVTAVKREGVELALSPLQLFTHVITHEFHHKGQVLNMSRQLGYTPADTDVIRF